MEIKKTTIDNAMAAMPNRIKRLLTKKRLMLIAVVGVLSSASYVYAVNSSPTNTFAAGEVISSALVNQNFAELYAGLNALETADLIGGGDAESVSSAMIVDGTITTADLAFPVEGVPSNAVMFFDAPDCPTGWSPYALLEGRVPVGTPSGGTVAATVGTPLGDSGARTISEVPGHSHSTPAATLTSSNQPGHTHLVDPAAAPVTGSSHSHTVNPPSTSTSTNGNHNHDIRTEYASGYGTYGVMGTVNSNGGDSGTGPIWSAGAHTHTLDIGSFSSSAASSGGSVDLPSTASSSAGGHSHSVAIPASTTGSAGVGSVDVTMPYVQLLACRKD